MSEQEIIEQVGQLDKEAQRRILIYLQAVISRPQGTSGKIFLERTEDIHIDLTDLQKIQQVIEEDLENVEQDE